VDVDVESEATTEANPISQVKIQWSIHLPVLIHVQPVRALISINRLICFLMSNLKISFFPSQQKLFVFIDANSMT
jgi:hypothetical protein